MQFDTEWVKTCTNFTQINEDLIEMKKFEFRNKKTDWKINEKTMHNVQVVASSSNKNVWEAKTLQTFKDRTVALVIQF